MTIYDAAMAAVLIAGMVRGAWRGITWQLASIGSLVLGYMFAFPISAQIAPMLPGPPETTRAMSMAAAYAVVSGAVFAAAWMVRGTIRKLKFEAFDRHLGMMLGGVEGAGVGILATLLIVSLSPNTRGPIFASPTGRVVGSVMNTLGPVLPGEVRKILEPFWGEQAASVQTIANDNSTVADSAPEVQAQAGLSPLTLPPLEAIPARDASVQPVSAPAVARPTGPNAVAKTPVDAADESELPSPRSVFDAVVERGKQKAEQFVAESLDTDTEQKAASLRELVEKDKTRIQNAVSDVVSGTKQSLANQVTEAVDATKANLTNQVAETVGATKQNLTNQLQGKAGQLQGKAKEVQGRVNQARGQISQAQQQVNRARQKLDQGIDGTIRKGQKQVEQKIGDTINKQLERLGGLDPAPEKTPR